MFNLLPIQVLYQHVPLLGESPPNEIHRSQWRDQHTEGQPQLNEGQGGGMCFYEHCPHILTLHKNEMCWAWDGVNGKQGCGGKQF